MNSEKLSKLKEIRKVYNSRQKKKYQNSLRLFDDIWKNISEKLWETIDPENPCIDSFGEEFKIETDSRFLNGSTVARIDGKEPLVEVDLDYVSKRLKRNGLYSYVYGCGAPSCLQAVTSAKKLKGILAEQEKLSDNDENKIDREVMQKIKNAIDVYEINLRDRSRNSYMLYNKMFTELLEEAKKAAKDKDKDKDITIRTPYIEETNCEIISSCSEEIKIDIAYVRQLFHNYGLSSFSEERNTPNGEPTDQDLVVAASVNELLRILTEQEKFLKKAKAKKTKSEGFAQVRK